MTITLKAMIETELSDVTLSAGKKLVLCSYYAEKGGLPVVYEKLRYLKKEC